MFAFLLACAAAPPTPVQARSSSTACTLTADGYELYPDADGDGYPHVVGGSCFHGPVELADGYMAVAFTGCWSEDSWGDCEDCDDEDASVFPGAEDPPYDGVDGDCHGSSDFDADGDGIDAVAYGGQDCDDADYLVEPAADEWCGDEVDNNCDGAVDVEPCGTAALLSAALRVAGEPGSGFGRSVTVADIDGDGRGEMVVGGDTALLLVDGTGAQLAAVPWGRADISHPEASATQDLDGDGRDDVIVNVYGDTLTTAVLFGNRPDVVELFDWHGTAVGDLTGDGRGDVEVGNEIYAGPLQDASPAATVWESTAGRSAGGHGVGDVTGDGLDDLVAQGFSRWLVEGPLSGTVYAVDTGVRLESDIATATIGSDVDGDGVRDLVVLRDSRLVYVQRGGPISTWTGEHTGEVEIESWQYAGVAVGSMGDVDDDGREELYIQAKGAFVLADEPTGTAVLEDVGVWWRTSASGWEATAAAGDLDGDGRGDLVLGTADADAVFLVTDVAAWF